MSLNKKLIAGGADVGYQGAAFNYVGGGTSDSTLDVGFEADLAFIIPTGTPNRVGPFNAYVIDRDVLGTFNWVNGTSSWFKTTVTGGCFAWNTNGFTIKGNNDTRYTVNYQNRDMTGICFKTSDTGVTNTDGTITSTVWANPDFGISKIKYQGNNLTNQTFGHGLGTTPEMVFMIELTDYSTGSGTKSSARGCFRYHNEGSDQEWRVGASNGKLFSGPDEDVSTFTANSTTITINGNSDGGKSNEVYLVIAFASASGFSKYASYTGNGSTSTRTILSAPYDPSSIFITAPNSFIFLDESFRSSGTTLPRWDSQDTIVNIDQESTDANLGSATEYIRADWRTNKRVLLNTDHFSANISGTRNSVWAFGGDNWNPVP